MDFASPSLARDAADAYVKAAALPQGLPEGKITDVADPHNGSLAMLLRGRTICGVFGAGGKALAHRYLKLLQARLPAAE